MVSYTHHQLRRNNTGGSVGMREGYEKAAIKRRLFQLQAGLCRRCHEECNFQRLELDHVTPISRGGSSTDDYNRQLLCKPCHKLKTLRESSRRANVNPATGYQYA